MRVLSVKKSGPLLVTPMGNRLYKVGADISVSVQTDIGCFCFDIFRGLVTNFRSGGWGVDPIIDQMGDEDKALMYLLHDLIYTPCEALGMEHPVSRKLGDQFLRAGLLYFGMGPLGAALVYSSVRICGESAYRDDDALTSANSKLFAFKWVDK